MRDGIGLLLVAGHDEVVVEVEEGHLLVLEPRLRRLVAEIGRLEGDQLAHRFHRREAALPEVHPLLHPHAFADGHESPLDVAHAVPVLDGHGVGIDELLARQGDVAEARRGAVPGDRGRELLGRRLVLGQHRRLHRLLMQRPELPLGRLVLRQDGARRQQQRQRGPDPCLLPEHLSLLR